MFFIKTTAIVQTFHLVKYSFIFTMKGCLYLHLSKHCVFNFTLSVNL